MGKITGVDKFLNEETERFIGPRRDPYEGPWIVGWQECTLCGAVQAAIAPIAVLASDNGYECEACGQMQAKWMMDERFTPPACLETREVSDGDDEA